MEYRNEAEQEHKSQRWIRVQGYGRNLKCKDRIDYKDVAKRPAILLKSFTQE